MGKLFDSVLGENESIFTDDALALDTDFQPPILKYRENEQHYIATCIKPLFQNRSGKNLLIFGSPGIGKTAAVKHILNELEKETEKIYTLYINAWKKDTSHKLVLDICDQLNYKFVQNRTTEELLKEITKILNKKSAVIIIDEIDKLQDPEILYSLIEDINKKIIILITNEKSWIQEVDSRIKSRLVPESLEFRPYTLEETKGILKQRIEYAFVRNVFLEEALDLVASKTYEAKDIRTGLFLLKEAGEQAELKSSRSILKEHAALAFEKLKDFNVKNSLNLGVDEREILAHIKTNSGKTIGQLHKEAFPDMSYRNFRRKIESLESSGCITCKENTAGKGKSTLIIYGEEKKLDQY
ncbi:AAA family ATPase [Candidatus Woesearchaeota archaeon]|nr:AAA family ATPase [Candidatus Woesearchaeota archaeon]